MSFNSLLIDTCIVKRFNETGTDGYGNPEGSWDDHLTDEPCRLVTITGREILIGAKVVVADYKLFLDVVDITEQDRVEIDETTYEVLMVSNRQDSLNSHHLECFVRTVR